MNKMNPRNNMPNTIIAINEPRKTNRARNNGKSKDNNNLF